MIEPLFPPGLSVTVALVVLGILIFLETRRRLRFLFLRIVSQVLLVSSLLTLTLRPSVPATDHESLILLTDGYEQKVPDSLSSLKATKVSSYNELSKLNGVKVITGQGLPSWALDLLPSKNYSFIPSSPPKGITYVETDEHIFAHRWNTIRGSYNGEATIKLRGPGGMDDSAKVSNGAFNLSFFAKAPGRFNYELITPGGSETLPVIIEPERTFRIIFVSGYPTFELRYLKNFLASKGHQLSVRNQVSKGKYKFEFANNPIDNFRSLTPALLSTTDLLIIDEPSWNSLSRVEQKNVRSAVSDGLGVIVMPEKGKDQLIQFNATQEKDTARIMLGKTGSVRLPALSLEVKKSSPVLTATRDRVVSGYAYSGSGKIGYQLLAETYQAGLQGKADMYSALWVPLLEKCARAQKEDFKLRITSPFPYYENEPISFDVISSGKQPPLKIDNVPLPLAEDIFIDDLWHGRTWLEGNSWHEFALDSTKMFVHVAKEGTWKSIRATNNLKETARQISTQESNTVATSREDSAIKIFLFLVLLFSAGFLWIAPKL
jgi:hypothetical protein